jgi:hypothetical protein
MKAIQKEETGNAALLRAPEADSAGNPTVPGTPEKAIRIRAVEIFLDRGAAHGADVDDWLQAERELNGTRRSQMVGMGNCV